jgi:superfamily I DNA and/or RNA helicase
MLKKVIKDRTIVLSTLSSSAMLADYPDNGYDTLIIDEATQAIEPEALIPITLFKHSLDRIVLVGDIQQLPPTVLDQDAARDGLSISMIERIQTITEHSVRPEDRSFARTLLDTQYRMHPEIADFSNNAFYDSLLKNDASVCGTGYAHPFGALAFLDIRGAEEKGLSISNEVEATYVSELAAAIASEGDYGIGVITPYRDQLRIIRQNLDRIPHLARAVEVNTVDGFQGREKDIIILSAVRANARGEVGFLTDHRRLNVAVTRAKKMLVICGCASTLRRGDEKWRMLVQHCEDRRRLFRMDGAASPEEARNAVAAWVEDRKRERTRR